MVKGEEITICLFNKLLTMVVASSFVCLLVFFFFRCSLVSVLCAQTDVALLAITACGTGLNLTRANVALFAELYWSPGAVLQAEDRIHRIGQKSNRVRIIYLIAKGQDQDQDH